MSNFSIILIFWAASLIAVFILALLLNKLSRKKDAAAAEELRLANTRLEQLDELKSEFVNIAAHQLRTPLSEVKWCLSYLKTEGKSFLDATQMDILERGQNANDRIIRIVNNLLEVERSEGLNWGYTFREASLYKIAEEVVNDFTTIASNKKISLTFNSPEMELPRLKVDLIKAAAVFSILIENALSYTPEGGEISLSFQKDGDFIRTAIKDTGIGIPKSEQGKVFSRFFRGQKAVTVRTDGTGVGLHIAKNIIEAHKGKIWFETTEGAGTTFYFTLPINLANNS